MTHSGPDDPAKGWEYNHLRRETRTALELAIVELAPTEVIEGLAVVAGLLEALAELPEDSPQVRALGPSTVDRARLGLEMWRKWSTDHKRLA